MDGIKKERDLGFELLRIISMTMIVLMHAIGHGGLGFSVPQASFSYYAYWFIYALSRVSTNCFVMITGYYMVKSKMRLSRVLRLWCEVLFYSVLTFFIAYKFGAAELSLSGIIKVFTPISSEGYWFATSYVIMYLLIPLLNGVIHGIKSQKEFKILVFGATLLTSVLPTVLYWSDPMSVNGGYSFVWFVTLYFIAAYIRLYGINIAKKTCFAIYLSLAALAPFLRAAAEFVQAKIGATTFVDNMMDYKMPITLIMSVAFFVLFLDFKVKNVAVGKIIAFLAPMSFGVYLMHDSEYIRTLLWDWVNMTRFDGLLGSLLYMAAVAIAIVMCGYIVNFIYKKLYALLPMRKLETKIDDFTEKKAK